LDTKRRIIYDWKTTTDLSDAAINRTISRFGYWFQSEFYRRVVDAATGKPHEFVMIFIRLEPSLGIRFVRMSPDWSIAADRVTDAVKKWGECLASFNWPDYPEMTSEPPQWMLAETLEADMDELDDE
jgi:hypothetical protein